MNVNPVIRFLLGMGAGAVTTLAILYAFFVAPYSRGGVARYGLSLFVGMALTFAGLTIFVRTYWGVPRL